MTAVSELINVQAQQRLNEPAFITGADDQTLTWLALVVVAAPRDRLGQVPVAFGTLQPRRDEPGLVEGLQWLCEQRLARYRWPTLIDLAVALPTGPTGKVLRRRVCAELPALGGIQ